MNSTVKTVIFWVFIFLCLILLWQVFQKSSGSGHDQDITFSQFMQDAKSGQVLDATVDGGDVHGKLKAGTPYHAKVPVNYPQLYDVLNDNHVAVTVRDAQGSSWLPILLNLSPHPDHRCALVLYAAPDAERRQ